MQEDKEFDFQQALQDIQAGKPLLGREGFLTPLIKKLTEAALVAELDTHLGQEIAANRRNGKSTKTIKSLTRFMRSWINMPMVSVSWLIITKRKPTRKPTRPRTNNI